MGFADINIGSIANNIYNSIAPFPVSVSGALPSVIQNKIIFVEQFVGVSIGSVISSTYQATVTDLSTADIVRLMALQDLGVQEMSIGGRDFVVNNNNLKEMAKFYEDRAMFQIKALTKGIKFFKARG